jgi:hypothetical protein
MRYQKRRYALIKKSSEYLLGALDKQLKPKR